MDGTTPTCAGVMNPMIGANSAPAMLANSAADGVGDDLDVGWVVAEEAHPLLAVAHRDQKLAVAALHQLADHRDDDQQHRRRR